MTTKTDRPDLAFPRIDAESRAYARFDTRAVGHVSAAPHWLRLGIAAALGTVTGTMLFATEAQGRSVRRKEQQNERR